MLTIQDFEDLLSLFAQHQVRYLIIGGLAFIYHAKPRYTKDMDLWVDPNVNNVKKANIALKEFGSPYLLNADKPKEIVQLGVAPNRIDLLLLLENAKFETAWKKRVRGRYGEVKVHWIDIETLIRIKSRINSPKHQEDVRVLREVKKLHAKSKPRKF
jgi:hypothetical protein